MTSLVEIGFINAALATALAMGMWLVTRIWRQPVLVHALWLIVLLKLITPPMVSIPWRLSGQSTIAAAPVQSEPRVAADQRDRTPISAPSKAPAKRDDAPLVATPVIEIDRAEVVNQPVPAPTSTGPMVDVPFSFSWVSVVASIWIAGTVTLLAVAFLRLLRFHRALRNTAPASDALSQLAEQVAARLGIIGSYRIRVTEGRLSPMVWPIGRPMIVLPRPLMDELTTAETQTLLAHELAHLRRKDHWVRWLELLSVTLYWWHPVAWWARAMIHRSEEQICDAWVVATFPQSSKSYASALFSALQFVSESYQPSPLIASRLEAGGNFKERIERIMSGTNQCRLSSRAQLAVLAVALLALPVSLRAVQADDAPANKSDTQAEAAIEAPNKKPDRARTTNSPPTTNGAEAEFKFGPYSTVHESTEREREIQRALGTPVRVSFVDMPLSEALIRLSDDTDVDFYIDANALEKEGLSSDEPVTIELKKEISLKSALNLILKPLGLHFVVEDEVLKITNESRGAAAGTFTGPAPVGFAQNDLRNINLLAAAPPSTSLGVLKKMVEANKRAYERMQPLVEQKAVSTAELEKARSDYEISVVRLKQAGHSVRYYQLLVELAEVEYQQALEVNKSTPNSVSELEFRKLKLKVELAEARLAALSE